MKLKVDRVLLKLAGLALLVVAAILFFAESATHTAYGLAAVGLACSVAGDIRS